MILTAGVIELLLVFRRDDRPSPIAGCCTWIGTIGACAAAWTGWSFGEEYGSGLTLELHRWFGVACAGVLIVAVIGWCIERFASEIWFFHVYRIGLWMGAALVVVSSFFGGEMVWGEGFLFEESDEPVPTKSDVAVPTVAVDPVDTEEAVETSLESQVILVMQEHCASCHGPEKQKGKLQLIPLAKAFPADRRDGWSIIPGKPEARTVIQRVTLPQDHFDIMPPKGDPLTSDQVDLLERWIHDGAPHSGQTAGQPPESVPDEPVAVAAPVRDSEVDAARLEAIDRLRSERPGLAIESNVPPSEDTAGSDTGVG